SAGRHSQDQCMAEGLCRAVALGVCRLLFRFGGRERDAEGRDFAGWTASERGRVQADGAGGGRGDRESAAIEKRELRSRGQVWRPAPLYFAVERTASKAGFGLPWRSKRSG